MSSALDSVVAKIRKMPPDLQKEVIGYINQLEQRSNMHSTKKFKFEWEGSLAHLKDRYTSVQLQHTIPDWWN
jgi:LPS O-antigen subunit length determinant protein (WzzB/FepE family)